MVFELAAQQKETGRVIGGIGLRLRSERRKEADLGYCYSAVSGGKVMVARAEALLKFGFEKLGLHRIYATCDAQESWLRRRNV